MKIKESATVKILNKLLNAKKNPVKLNSYYVERKLIPNGKGSLSCSRIIRALRNEYNLISYEDPRKKNHIYEIYLNEKEIKKFLKRKLKKVGGKNAK